MKTFVKEISVVNNSDINSPILPNGPGWESTESDELLVVESGPEKVLFNKVISLINEAEHLICLQSFLIQDSGIIDALVKAGQERRVKVYVLGSAEARLKETIEEDEDHIRPKYIALLETKFRNNFIHRVAENFHAKYILVDPKTAKKGFLCSSNFTDNGFFYSPELAIELNKKQVEELFKIFVYHFWEHATDEQNSGDEFDRVEPARRFNLSETNDILLTSPNPKLCSLNTALISAIKTAQKSVSISTYILDKNVELVKALIDKAKSGVPVTVFCRSLEWLFENTLKGLVQVGIKVIMHPLMHGKSLLVDDETGYIFTANLIENGLHKGFEVGAKLSANQTSDLVLIHSRWLKTFPYKVAEKSRVSDLSEVYVFNGKTLESKSISEDQKELSKRVRFVSDFKSFFDQNLSSGGQLTKRTNYKLTATLDELPSPPNLSTSKNFEVLEIDNGKDNKEKVVVIKDSFNSADVSELEGYSGLRILSV